jgi:TolB-like protein/DNA-binding winged helix-turn-helix (wHTH) protein/cytochrome c-type biogenesis protein CcmH/NrfG
MQEGHFYEFGDFRMDLDAGVLQRQGQRVPLTPKVFETLRVLVERHGRLVSRDDLVAKVWPDTFVEEGNLASNISVLRRALGDAPDGRNYIETIPKRGYRFTAEVRSTDQEVETAAGPAEDLSEAVSQETREESITRDLGPEAEPIGSRLPIRSMIIASLAVLTLAGAAILWRARPKPPASSEQIHSIAVLPLRNLSRDPEQEFLSDGTTEALISNLARIHALRVISRTSIMRYKGIAKSVPEIGRELGVDAVVEGSVQRSGGRVRISAQLIRTATDTHLWANEYEREMVDVLKLEAEVAQAIAREIRVQVTPEERTRWADARSVNPAAEDAYLLGRYHKWKLNEQDLRQAIESFQHAIDLQPDFAAAYAGLGKAWLERGIWGAKGFREVEAPARMAATRAVVLDPGLPEAHSSLAEILSSYDWKWAAAASEHERAIDLDPNNLEARAYYAGFLMALGRHREAIAQIERAAALDPLSSTVHSAFGRILFRARRFDEAVPHFRRAIELDSQNYGAYTRLAEVYEQTGHLEDAVALVRQGLLIRGAEFTKTPALGLIDALLGHRTEALDVIKRLTKPGTRFECLDIALIYFALGEKDIGFEWLNQAFEQRQLVIYVNVDPRFDRARSDPRFQALVRRLRMPD